MANSTTTLLPDALIRRIIQCQTQVSDLEAPRWVDEEIGRASNYLIKLRSFRNTFIPIIHRKLPVELFVEIFRLVRGKNFATDDQIRWMRTVMPVCRYWRQISLNSPELWSSIDMRYPKLADIFLSRSHEADLYFCWKEIRSTSNILWPAMYAVVAPHTHRMTSIDIALNWEGVKKFEKNFLCGSLPRLHRLSLTALSPCHEETGEPISLHHIPSLKALKLINILVNWESPIFRDLQYLDIMFHDTIHISKPLPKQVLGILSRCPDIVEFSCNVSMEAGLEISPHFPAITLPHCRKFHAKCNIPSDLRHVFLPNVRDLQIHYCVIPLLPDILYELFTFNHSTRPLLTSARSINLTLLFGMSLEIEDGAIKTVIKCDMFSHTLDSSPARHMIEASISFPLKIAQMFSKAAVRKFTYCTRLNGVGAENWTAVVGSFSSLEHLHISGYRLSGYASDGPQDADVVGAVFRGLASTRMCPIWATCTLNLYQCSIIPESLDGLRRFISARQQMGSSPTKLSLNQCYWAGGVDQPITLEKHHVQDISHMPGCELYVASL